MNGPAKYHLGKFPPPSLDWERLIPLIGAAHAGLARYDGLLTAIPNASVLLSPLTTQEAVLSSRIEGTQATIGEVLEVEVGGEPPGFDEPKRGDVEEILNYRRVMHQCVAGLNELPLSQRLLRQAHQTLPAEPAHARGRGFPTAAAAGTPDAASRSPRPEQGPRELPTHRKLDWP